MGERVTNAEILNKVNVIESDVRHIKATTDEMHKVVHGNGDPKAGLTSRMTVMETIIERLERIVWMVGGAVVVAVIGAVFAIIRSG
jgi:hypothetical protein